MLIGTDRFRSVLEATKKIAGVEEVRWAEVPHPIGSLDTAGLRHRARLAVDQFEEIVLIPAEPDRRGGSRSGHD